MAMRPGARRPGVIIAIGVVACALLAAIGCGRGLPETVPSGCAVIAIDLAAGAVGEPTPEAALELWLATGASPLAPRTGWTTARENGLLYKVNGPHRVEISDLSRGGGSGWMVTGSNCA
ncbi:hypothetical protein [Microlunatus sp. GCM10028923]|uniref:hypothetical protein n=1 Tax=Microlunatus sp. GCM10028923 TaxID=3273400 RepID=UPI003605F014